jgi:hypothetical protein
VFALGTALLFVALVALARSRAHALRANPVARLLLAFGLALQFVAIVLDVKRDDRRETQIQASTDPGCSHW